MIDGDQEKKGDTSRQNEINVALILRDLAYIRERLDQMYRAAVDQNARLDRTERVAWAVSAVAGLLAAIFVPIAIAAIKKWFGL